MVTSVGKLGSTSTSFFLSAAFLAPAAGFFASPPFSSPVVFTASCLPDLGSTFTTILVF
jgi:hypothetical protein